MIHCNEFFNWEGNTALWIAHVRALENKRSDAIVRDQFAEILAGKEGKEIYEHYQKYRKQQRMVDEFLDAMSVRCRFYDDMALSKSNGNCKQVVILASGLDSRAFRLKWSPNVHVFEVDRKEVSDFKLNKLKEINATPTCDKHSIIEADLTEDSWPQKMKDKGFNPEAPSLWLVEGLLMYLPEDGVRKLLQKCSNLSPSGSFIGGDVGYVPSLLKRMPIFEEAKRLGNPFLFHTKYPEKLFQECGWPNVTATQKGEPGVTYTRSKIKVLPRWVPLMPRNFYVQASK